MMEVETLWGELVAGMLVVIANRPLPAIVSEPIVRQAGRVTAAFIFTRAVVALIIHYL